MRKAERIFRNILNESEAIIRAFGITENEERPMRAHFDTTGTDHVVCQRTVDDVAEELTAYMVRISRRAHVMSEKHFAHEREVIRLAWTAVLAGQDMIY